jgi:hypothetical protein
MICLFLALAVGSSLMARDAVPVVGLGTGPVFSGATTNIVAATNHGTIGVSNIYTAANSGSSYTIAAPSNYATLGFDNFTPDVADFVNGQTVWRTSGIFRYRFLLMNSNSAISGLSGSLACGTNQGSYSAYAMTNYESGSLGYFLMTNMVARTNVGRDGVIWDSINSTGWTWHTNSIIYGTSNFTGLSQVHNIFGPVPTVIPTKWTAVTRRHAYSAGHVFDAAWCPGGTVYFVDAAGTSVPMVISSARSRFTYNSDGTMDDYCIVFFNSDLPTNIVPLRASTDTNFMYRFPFTKVSPLPIPSLETCQHGRIGSQQMQIFDNHQMHVGGDSGNPKFFLAGNELVTYQGTSGTFWNTTNFINDFNYLTTNAGLSTNLYWPNFYDLSAYPFHYP